MTSNSPIPWAEIVSSAGSEPLARGLLAGDTVDPHTLDRTLQGLLDTNPEAFAFAMDASATRVPLPADRRFAECRSLPGEQPTGIDFVVPADRLAVSRCWDAARAVGVGQARVRLACLPDQTLTFTIVDHTHHHGVWIGLIYAEDGWVGQPAPDSPHPAAVLPIRPRTAVLQKNVYGVITGIDERTSRMLGWSAEEMVGRRALDFIHPGDKDRAVGQWLEMRARRATQRVRLRHRHRDGHWIWVEIENVWVGLDDHERVVAMGHMTDISDEMAAIEAVRRQERLFRRLAESLPVGVFQIGADHRIVYANGRAGALLGVVDAGTLGEQVANVDVAHRAVLTDAVGAALDSGADRQVEVDVHPHPDGQRRRHLFTVAALSGAEGRPGAIVSVTDITEGAQLREELRVKATYDPLTGCLNRSAVLAELERVVTAPDVDRLAVVFVDLDAFKSVNDTHGHAVGDELLTVAAARLAAQARPTDLVGRIGGDEFLLICPDVADRTQALRLAQRVHDHLRATVPVTGARLRLAASVGVTLARVGATADLLVAESDSAMYQSKRTGTGPVFFARA